MSRLLLRQLKTTAESQPNEPAEMPPESENLPDTQTETINKYDLEEFLMDRRIIDINRTVDAKSVQHWINQIDMLCAISKDPILFRINSNGGNLDDGLALYDVIRMYADAGVQMDAIVLGKCCSMATVILLACDRREALPNTSFMVHSASLSMGAAHFAATDAINLASGAKRSNNKIARIYASRAGDTLKAWNDFLNELVHDYYFDCKEAKKLGFLTR